MLIFFLNLAVEYNKSRDMNNEVLERLKEEYGEDDDLIQLYEDWGILPIYMKYTVYWMNIHLIGCWNVN